MNPSEISLILRELNLTDTCVANIYHHGSWVHGTNTSESDRDLIVITHSPQQKPIRFHEDFDYFHEFELHKLWNQYDICVYSVQNFEILLQKNYLVAVQCVFLPDAFKIKEEINFQTIYLEKYYNPLRLKQVAFYEMSRDLNLYDQRDQDSCSKHPKCSSRGITTSALRMNYIFKNLFHGLRYLDYAEQLIQTKSIYNFQRATPLFDRMKNLRGNPPRYSGLRRVVTFVHQKTVEYKSKFNALMPKNIIRGRFEVNITFDCTQNTPVVIDKLKKVCRNTKYKVISIEWIKCDEEEEEEEEEEENLQELMVLVHYDGEYPSIVKQIEDEARQHFQGFHIIRIKINSPISNEGVPRSDLEKQFFWYNRPYYFQFRYKLPSKEDPEEEKLANLCDMCSAYFQKYSDLRLSQKAFMKKREKDRHYMFTMRLFDVGQRNGFARNNGFVKYLTNNNFPPLKVIRDFVVYNTNIHLVKI